jgi:hypothetical protein
MLFMQQIIIYPVFTDLIHTREILNKDKEKQVSLLLTSCRI